MSGNLNTNDAAGQGAPVRFEVDFLESYDAASIIAEMKRVAAKLGKENVSAVDMDTYGRVKYHIIVKQFGSLRKALEAAELKLSRFRNASDEELLTLLADLWTITLRESGRRPRMTEMAKYGISVSAMTFVKRFGSWKRALLAVANSMSPDASPGVCKIVSVRRVIPVGKRYLVMKRDRYRCRMCHQAGVELEVDHVVPVSQGGSDRLDNLQTLCRDCNRGKGGRLQ